jgi:hypothetical protein
VSAYPISFLYLWSNVAIFYTTSNLTKLLQTQVEFVEFLHGTKAALVAFDSSPKGDTDQFKYWDNSNYAREQYRYLTNTTFTGEQAEVRDVMSCHVMSCEVMRSDEMLYYVI